MKSPLLRSIVLVMISFPLLFAGCKENKDPKKTTPAAAQLLPADDYRQELTTIDRLVFTDALDDRYRMMVVGNMAALAGRLDVPSRPPAVRARLQDLRDLAVRISERRLNTPQQVQAEWVRVRTSLFGEREWFASSTSETMEWVQPGAIRGDAAQVPQSGGSGAAAPPRFELPGRWSVVDVEVNGMPMNDSDAIGATWSFGDDGLTVDRGPVAGSYSFVEYIDSRGEALRLESEDGSLSGWMLYRFTPDGKLLVSFHENLTERPEDFDAPEAVEVVPSTDTAATSTTATSAEAAADARAAERERIRQERLNRNRRPNARAESTGPAHYRLVLDPVQ